MPADYMVPGRTVNTEERLPFTVRAVSGEDQLRKAVSIRYHAYGRHVPALAELLRLLREELATTRDALDRYLQGRKKSAG